MIVCPLVVDPYIDVCKARSVNAHGVTFCIYVCFLYHENDGIIVFKLMCMNIKLLTLVYYKFQGANVFKIWISKLNLNSSIAFQI